MPPQALSVPRDCKEREECQDRTNTALRQWGTYMEQRMADFEQKAEQNLNGVETRLKADIRDQAAKTELAMRDLQGSLTKLLGEHRDEIREALHKGDLTFQSITNTVQNQGVQASQLEAKVVIVEGKVAAMEGSALRQAFQAAGQTTVVDRPAVPAAPSLWMKFIAPNLAAGLVSLAISGVVGGGMFILKSQWEDARNAEIKKAEEARAADARHMMALAETLKSLLAAQSSTLALPAPRTGP